MRRMLNAALIIMLAAGIAHAQYPGRVGVFGDPSGTDCDFIDGSGLIHAYIVHMYTPGATGCQFRLDDSEINMVFLGELVTPPFLSIGNVRSGIAITYGACLSSPIMVVDVSYLAQGLTPPCSYFHIVDDPTAAPPGIYVVDCAMPAPNLLTASGGTAVVNPDGSCNCDVPGEDTTWGKIKNLYQ
jgi:hypothetical protein